MSGKSSPSCSIPTMPNPHGYLGGRRLEEYLTDLTCFSFVTRRISNYPATMVSYVSKLATKTMPYMGKMNASNLISYLPNLALWGAASTASTFVFTSGWPKFQDTFYKKIPVLGAHWEKEIPPEDRIN